MPYVMRGLLIHLMNNILDNQEFHLELKDIVQYMEILLNSEKEAGLYLERYLT